MNVNLIETETHPTTPDIKAFYAEQYPAGSEVGWPPVVYTLPSGHHLISDGHHLLSIPGTEQWERVDPPEEPFRGPSVEKLLSVTKTCDPDEAEWVSLARPDRDRPKAPWQDACRNCLGGKACQCPACENEHECSACDDNGLVWEWPRREPAIIREGWPGVDLEVVRRALWFFPETVRAASFSSTVGKYGWIAFESNGALAVVMERRTDELSLWEESGA